jgi:hypothetical protein
LVAFFTNPILLPEWSSIDALAAILILAGILCQFLYRRMPAGLGTSLFVWAVTIAAGLIALSHHWFGPGELLPLTRVAALLCAVWAFFGWLAAPRARPVTVEVDRPAAADFFDQPARHSDPAASASAAFFAWALVLAVFVAVLTSYLVLFEASARLLNPDRDIEQFGGSGAWNVLALLVAMLFRGAAAPRSHQPTIALILVAYLVVWSSLMIPSGSGSYEATPDALSSIQPDWWIWSLQMQVGLVVLLLVASALQEWRYRGRRRRAWPDKLDDLLDPYSTWPGFIQSEAVIAAMVLLLGVYHIVHEGPPHWQLIAMDCIASAIAGFTCMYMTYRRWSANTAGLGMALLTLATVSLACVPVVAFGNPMQSGEYATRLPVLYNAALLALALMIALWSWLSRFWEQQLLNGIPWTTTGRMIPHARRAARLLIALAVLVGYQMALWPVRVLSSVEDNSPARMIFGITSLLLLAWISAKEAQRRHGDTAASLAASLSVALVIAMVIFVFLRLPTSAYRGWLIQYDAAVLSVLTLPILIAAELLPRTMWRCFAQPLWWLALLALPTISLLELLRATRPASEWIRPATFASLALLYILAGRREHRRALLVLGGVLLLATVTQVMRNYGIRLLS